MAQNVAPEVQLEVWVAFCSSKNKQGVSLEHQFEQWEEIGWNSAETETQQSANWWLHIASIGTHSLHSSHYDNCKSEPSIDVDPMKTFKEADEYLKELERYLMIKNK